MCSGGEVAGRDSAACRRRRRGDRAAWRDARRAATDDPQVRGSPRLLGAGRCRSRRPRRAVVAAVAAVASRHHRAPPAVSTRGNVPPAGHPRFFSLRDHVILSPFWPLRPSLARRYKQAKALRPPAASASPHTQPRATAHARALLRGSGHQCWLGNAAGAQLATADGKGASKTGTTGRTPPPPPHSLAWGARQPNGDRATGRERPRAGCGGTEKRQTAPQGRRLPAFPTWP